MSQHWSIYQLEHCDKLKYYTMLWQALESIGDLSLAMGPHTKGSLGSLLPAVLAGWAASLVVCF